MDVSERLSELYKRFIHIKIINIMEKCIKVDISGQKDMMSDKK